MCKRIILLITLTLISAKAFSQDETAVIYEKGFKDINGYTFYLDNFWIENGKIKATIEVYKSPNAKPFSGGYSLGDAIDMNIGDQPMTMYVNEIFKLGKDDLGYVVLQSGKPSDTTAYYSDIFELTEGAEREAGNLALRVVSVREGEALLDMRNSRYDSLLYKNRYPVRNEDTVWLGRALYQVNSIFNETVYMSKIFDYLPPGNAIPGEVINQPGVQTGVSVSEGHLLMRKMHYFRSKKENPGVIKYCLVRIVSEYVEVNGEMVMVARPFIALKVLGETIYRPFEFVKTFETEEEALAYAKEHNITDVNLSGIEE
jgi:hypothetical protein